MSFGWIIFSIFGIGVGTVAFILITDGRYFGKSVSHWAYDHFGAAIFSSSGEAERWHALADDLHLRGNECLLDVGTAIGNLPLSLVESPTFSGKIIGIDRSPQMIALAEKTAKARQCENRAAFQLVDVSQGLPFAGGKFDVVFCFGVLEALPHPEGLLQEMFRVLTPDGKLVLSLYKGWSATSATLSLNWYQKHLPPLGLSRLRIAPCRRSQDVVVAERG